eukprot:scaffold129520_cov32-Prasinocladus_malaysianus.AAC.1
MNATIVTNYHVVGTAFLIVGYISIHKSYHHLAGWHDNDTGHAIPSLPSVVDVTLLFFRYLVDHKDDTNGRSDGGEQSGPDGLGNMWKVSSSAHGSLIPAQSVASKAPTRWDRIRMYKLDFWNLFDLLVVVVCYLPLGANMVAVI